MQLSHKQIKNFQELIYDYYNEFGRTFSWRKTTNPYHIFISEVMLQQTQTSRVEKKYEQFIAKFPDFASLAQAPLYKVLQIWQGLGYNRRAKFLHQSAQIIMSKYNGQVPKNTKLLQELPGIGTATAGSIAAFAFDAPTVFVETNIKVVFIHLFLDHKEIICDKELLCLAAQTVDRSSPRAWYYAITDYGAMLKSKGVNPIQKSKTYTKQSKFQGSDRQIRGEIIRILLKNKNQALPQICNSVAKVLESTPERTTRILQQLLNEQLVVKGKRGKNDYYSLTS